MKLQHLSVIFVVIIIPILIVLEQYMHLEIKTIVKQTEYSSKLSDATYDAVKAFQANTINNKYSSVADSKIRDIQASITTFKNSLSSIFESQTGSIGKDIDIFIPAILFNLYDGYYIYGKYDNYYTESTGISDSKKHITGYGIRPFVYYSCRYKRGTNTDVVINYTLDNRITINGKAGREYMNESGYLISTAGVSHSINYHDLSEYNRGELINQGIKIDNETTIKPELTRERIVIVDDAYNVEENEEFYYTVFKGNKYYINNDPNAVWADYNYYNVSRSEKRFYDKNSDEPIKSKDGVSPEQQYLNNPKYFYYRNNKKVAVSIGQYEVLNHLTALTSNNLDNPVLYNDAAVKFYVEAYEFSKMIQSDPELRALRQSDAKKQDGSSIDEEYFKTNIDGCFLDTSNPTTNNPLSDTSIFYQIKYNVIRRSIETNLKTAIANFATYGTYDLPVIGEKEWDQIIHNISITSFMQGIPIGTKMFNDYEIVSNNVNNEVVTNNSIYIVDNVSTKKEAHSPGCTKFLNSIDVNLNAGNFVGYSNTSFERQSISDGNEDKLHYYPHSQQKCYSCIINTLDDFDENYLISKEYTKIEGYDDTKKGRLDRLRTVYLSALAREKYTLDQLYK